ncbi:MAG: tetratricopeptide repeat protein [Croceitalea sp.]|nr:tetratricopeptide repeat protein [Croceitalea sp.]
MKTFLFFLMGCLLFQANAQEQMTSEDWREDLKFLQKTVHNDYDFLFKKTTATAFDAAVDELFEAIPNLEEHEIVIGLARIVSSFEYGHTVLGFRYQPHSFHQLPLHLYEFKDGIYVQGTNTANKNVLGAKVLEVAGMPIKEAIKAIYPVVPAENEQFFKAYGLHYLTIPEVLHAQGITSELSNTIAFTLEKNGKSFKQQLASLPLGEKVPTNYGFVETDGDWLDARNQDSTPNYLKHLDKVYYYEYLPEHKTLYVRQSQIQDDASISIPAFYKEVFDFVENNEVERLVLDVRLNGGGNNYKNKPIVTGIIETEKINKVGKLFVITGRRTFSACQNLVNELDNYTNAIFVGEPTAENINFYGDNRRVELPNSKIPAYLSFAWWQDKPQWEGGKWLAPHLDVSMTFEEYKNNEDPVLQTALTFNDSTFVLDPMEHLTNLFMAGDIERLQSEVDRMYKDPKYQFFNFEGALSTAGYQLLNNGQYESAIFVFQMVVQYFPDSANAWNGQAEAHLKVGNKEKAIEFYKKVIVLDADGELGQNAKTALNTLN